MSRLIEETHLRWRSPDRQTQILLALAELEEARRYAQGRRGCGDCPEGEPCTCVLSDPSLRGGR